MPDEERTKKKRSSADELTTNMLASTTCVGVAVFLFNPLDCLRIRWQVQTQYPSMATHLKGVLRNEGLLRGLWLPGVLNNAVGGGLSRGIGIGCYPTIRDAITKLSGGETKSGGSMFVAGLLAGGLGYGISTPFWVLKTKIQAGLEHKSSLKSCGGAVAGAKPTVYPDSLRGLRMLWHEGRLPGLFRGTGALVVRGALMNAGNTLGYDFTKTYNKKHHIVPEGPALHVVASLAAALLSSTFSVPADFVMTRYQASSEMGRNYKSVLHCVKDLHAEGGVRGFFRGWTPLFTRVAPLYILYLPAYEQFRKAMGLDYLD